MHGLKQEIKNLIDLKTEGGYWDFKKEWYSEEKISDLLIDIICMANNLENHDAYIIIGVEDTTGEIVGVQNDNNRRNQENIISFLRGKKFARQCRPEVYVKTFKYEKEVDVIVIKNTINVPYYLIDDYKHDSYPIKKNYIYTRVGDTNTPRNEQADPDKIEYLWKKRFGLNLKPYDKMIYLLKDIKGWYPVGTDGVHSSLNHAGEYYHQQNPEFTISIKKIDNKPIDKIETQFYWMHTLPGNQPFNCYLCEMNIKYYSTIIYSNIIVCADNFRFNRILWKHSCLSVGDKELYYCYIELNSIEYYIDNWLSNIHETKEYIDDNNIKLSTKKVPLEYVHNPYESVLIFDNKTQRLEFEQTLINSDITMSQEYFDKDENVATELDEINKIAHALNQCLKDWKKNINKKE